MKHRFVKLTALVTLVALAGIAYAQQSMIVTTTFYSDNQYTKAVGLKITDHCHFYQPTVTVNYGNTPYSKTSKVYVREGCVQ